VTTTITTSNAFNAISIENMVIKEAEFTNQNKLIKDISNIESEKSTQDTIINPMMPLTTTTSPSTTTTTKLLKVEATNTTEKTTSAGTFQRLDYKFEVVLKSSIAEARSEISMLVMNHSSLDVKGISVTFAPIATRRKRRDIDSTHNVSITLVHLLPTGRPNLTGNVLAVPFLESNLKTAEINFENFNVFVNMAPQLLTNLPGEITTTTTATTITDRTKTTKNNEKDDVVEAITGELPSFDLSSIFGSSEPKNRPDIIGAQSVVNSETVSAVSEKVQSEKSLASANRPSQTKDVDVTGNRPQYQATNISEKNGPNTFPTYIGKAGRYCLKCDSLSYSECISSAISVKCQLGDLEHCFFEVRKLNGNVEQVSSGCKHKVACEDLKHQNFIVDLAAKTSSSIHDQCKPNVKMASRRFGRTQSTCRQCFSTSDGTTGNSLQLGGSAEELRIPKWDDINFWRISDEITADSENRSFWLENLYDTQKTNNL
jgi:hypothetical protein